MGILHAVLVATTMLLIVSAWHLTFEQEALEEGAVICSSVGGTDPGS